MALSRETTVARADMNDEFGVTIWQAKKTADYTIAEARTLAAEIVRAANEAERVARDDAWRSEGDLPEGFGFDVDLTVTPAATHFAFDSAKHTLCGRNALGLAVVVIEATNCKTCIGAYSANFSDGIDGL